MNYTPAEAKVYNAFHLKYGKDNTMQHFTIYRTATVVFAERTTIEAETKEQALEIVNEDPEALDWKQADEERAGEWMYAIDE